MQGICEKFVKCFSQRQPESEEINLDVWEGSDVRMDIKKVA
jgi:hypothetical protein